jgi:hypothetical protein
MKNAVAVSHHHAQQSSNFERASARDRFQIPVITFQIGVITFQIGVITFQIVQINSDRITFGHSRPGLETRKFQAARDCTDHSNGLVKLRKIADYY